MSVEVPSPTAEYFLRLLGNPVLEGLSGRGPARSVPQQRLALLALLGSGGDGGLSRDKVIGLLWPDRSDGAARHLLADAVYRVRKELGEEAIVSDGEMLRLNATTVHVDVETFKTTLARNDLESAVDAYSGPFLDGFHLSGDLRDFEHWVDSERSRLGLEYETALESLAEHAEAEGDDVRAIGAWRRFSQHDPANSRVALRLMRALARAGDLANAVQFASEHERYLREEFDLRLPLEVLDLANALREASDAERGSRRSNEGGIRRWTPFAGYTDPPRSERMPLGFVAREREIEELTADLKAAVAGRGRVKFIRGEAGAGKTALADEFCHRAMHDRADLMVAVASGNAQTGPGDPYHVFRDILCLLTGDVEAALAAGSMTVEHATRLWNLLPTATAALVDHGPDLLGTLVRGAELLARAESLEDPDPVWRSRLARLVEARSRRPEALPTQSSLSAQCARVLEAVARARPLLLVLDDLQWADHASIDLLHHLGEQLHGSRILILGLYRPSDVALGRHGGRHPLDSVVNVLVARYGDIELPVGEDDDRAFVDALIDAEPNTLGSDFRSRLFGLTRGNPLFTVGLIHGMRDDGTLLRDEADRWSAGPTLDWSRLPARIEAVIAERIARVPEPLQHVLRLASVEGETFALEAVTEVLGLRVDYVLPRVGSELDRKHRLVRADGVRRVGSRQVSLYRFGHNLIQQYLYGQLDAIERSHLHERLGVALETLYGEKKDQIALSLARHFREAGLPDRAATYLYTAGKQAMAAGANREALVHFGSAMDLLMVLPPTPERDLRELDVQLALGNARHYAGCGGQEEAFARAHELAKRLASPHKEFWALAGLYFVQGHFAGNIRQGFELAQQCLSLARTENDTSLLAAALEFVAKNAWLRGEFRTALTCYEELLSFYDPAEHRWEIVYGGLDLGPVSHGMVALALRRLGHPDQAHSRLQNALTLAREAEASLTLPYIIYYDILSHMWPADAGYARTRCEELSRVSTELGQEVFWEPIVRIHMGWCQAHQDEVVEGIETIRKGLDGWTKLGWSVAFVYYTALLAQALRVGRRADEGLLLLEEARSRTATVDELWMESEIHWTRGELMLDLDEPDPVSAETAFRQAIEVARDQEARSDELRATTSLARLLQSQRRTDEARAMLGEIYGWFTEGFDTADLIEARALLDELEATG